MKTAKKMEFKKIEKSPEENIAGNLMAGDWTDIAMTAIFNTMRILKKINQGDTYYEAYLGMRKKYGEKFFDTYQLLWKIGTDIAPKRILEIGTRTGISLCQLLSAHDQKELIETIVCVDPFDQWTSPNLVRANLNYLNLPSRGDEVKIHPIKSEDYFRQTEGLESFDFILVDGDHSKDVAALDLEASHKLIEHGGILVFDDISTAPGECALIDVWEAWKRKHQDEYYFYEVMQGKGVAWAIRK